MIEAEVPVSTSMIGGCLDAAAASARIGEIVVSGQFCFGRPLLSGPSFCSGGIPLP